MDTENIDSNNLNVQGPKYMHPNSDVRTRPPISSKGELKEMYPELSPGIGTLKNYRYYIELDPKVKPVIHLPRKITYLYSQNWRKNWMR